MFAERAMKREVKPMRILIVEDELLIAADAEAMLTDAGHEIVGMADDLESALIAADEGRPELALVDIQLSGGASGLDVAAELRGRGVPVMFVTGNCPNASGRDLALGCLHKPFDRQNIVATVVAAGQLMRGVQPRSLPHALHLY